MKRFRFNLEKVLALREENEKNWEIKLGEVVSSVNNVKREINSIEHSKREHFKDFSLSKEGLEYLQMTELYFRKMEDDRKRLMSELEDLSIKRAEVQREYLKALNEKKVIEKLKERRAAEYYKEQMLSEIKELDDMATGIAARVR